MVGETEATLREKGVDYVAGRARYADIPRGDIIGDQTGFLKLLFRRDDMRLLGVHVIGEQATELVHIGLIAMLAEAGADLFNRACFNYPTLGDLYKYAAYDALAQRNADASAQKVATGMSHEKYERLIAAARAFEPVPTAVAHHTTRSSLSGAVDAATLGLIKPILVGPRARIEAVAKQFKLDIAGYAAGRCAAQPRGRGGGRRVGARG